ncbi:tautomerase family protein [Paraburkholderia fungorum]|uniref:tautomerase family protein n=1 Tax=Paraburkholderia fungorum TaxID=134537 RepID=UPI0038B8925A
MFVFTASIYRWRFTKVELSGSAGAGQYKSIEATHMPLLRFDVVKGRTDAELKAMLDASHRAVLSAFNVPARDRYQIVHEHEASRMMVEDTGLGFDRSSKVVIVSVTSRPRSEMSKRQFYADLCRELAGHAGIEPSDVVVTFTINSDTDWSFGGGKAQFLTGEL